MNKYPELAQNKADFEDFFSKNSKYKISSDTVKKLLIENKKTRNYVEK